MQMFDLDKRCTFHIRILLWKGHTSVFFKTINTLFQAFNYVVFSDISQPNYLFISKWQEKKLTERAFKPA